MKLADLKDKNIAILGFGLEGKSTLNFLMNQNVGFGNLTILDVNKNLKTSQLVEVIVGEDYLKNLDQYDVIFKSAGIPMNEKLSLYKEKIITQVQLFFDNYEGKVIAVTATKGKSTITSLIYKILQDAGYKVKLVGNIGNPVLDEIHLAKDGAGFDQHYDYVVIELSSYMLDTLHKKNYISVLGSIFPEHLDWHGTFEYYTKSKLNILHGSEHNVVHRKTLQTYKLQDIVSDNGKYSHLITYGSEGKYKRYYGRFMEGEKKLFSENDRNILGEHNLDNICAALAVADLIGLPLKTCHQSIKEFKGLPHRMENLGVHGGIQWIDDAISTTPESTIQAIKTFGKRIDTIFLGGTDRGYNFKELVQYLFEYKIRNVILFPDSGHKIQEFIKGRAKEFIFKKIDDFEHCVDVNGGRMKLLFTESMQEAVKFSYAYTEKGKIALLSTASPSYSLRKNFEEKGNLFKQYIHESANDFGAK